MIKNKSISTLVIAFLVFSFFFLALPENGYSGTNGMAIGGCCISEPGCIEFGPDDVVLCISDSIIQGGQCTQLGQGGECVPPPTMGPITTNVPTLSEWGLLSLAVVLGILGIVGFMVIRRRKVTV